ncbi:aminodeoxychorismate lyase [Marinobacter halophilus]|uniref:Aminodeoxychorismate lyase n=1 Tax=Marinobacter halophilus TaxID=1323740 RepID=A0A2T1K950_9GAMM|nr:aminodeoxychorismate lyase [Marinobacter halophilus]PSF06655.1 aminodeoxychorismate lyase [Marinobacter halophilus]GGC74429.1 aminodeoxychorismate lyase [Marinobacter halophilus]
MFHLYWADEGGVPAGDRGLAYGDGLFETMSVTGDRPPLLAYHLDRLSRDAGRLAIPAARSELEKVCSQALARYSGHYGARPWVLKLTLTRGSGGRGYRPEPGIQPNLVISHSTAPAPADTDGVVVDFSRVPLTVNPLFAGIKSLNRLEQVMAARELRGEIYEVLMSNRDGHVVEGTRTNLFVRSGDAWITPPSATLAVAGVMRRYVLDRLHTAGEEVREAPLSLVDLVGERCQGLWLTNSVLGVVSVRNLAGHDLPVDQRLATIVGSPAILD